MTDATIIRAVFPRHPVKRLARLLGLTVSTAHEWTYRNVSEARRRDLALALIAEMDAQDVARDAIRRRLATWAGDLQPGLRMGLVKRIVLAALAAWARLARKRR